MYGRGVHTTAGDAYVQSIFDGLHDLHTGSPLLNVAFADFARIWDGVLGPDPGYKVFGYTSTDSCVIGDGTSTVGSCDDPEHYFYWIPGCVCYLVRYASNSYLALILVDTHQRRRCELWRIMLRKCLLLAMSCEVTHFALYCCPGIIELYRGRWNNLPSELMLYLFT